VLRVDAVDGRVRAALPTGDHPHGVAQGADGRLWVGAERADAVTVAAQRGRIATLRVAAQPGSIVAAQGGRRIAVVSVRERVVEVFDAATLARVGRAPAGVGPTHAAALGRWLWVTDTQGEGLLIFRLRPRLELVRRLYLGGGPYGIALDPVRRRLWVTLTGRNQVVTLPAHGRPHVLRRLATVRQPNSVAVDPASGRLFIAGRADGVLQIVDP
jgi:DNA-binding beta-propeller fold protein YncE